MPETAGSLVVPGTRTSPIKKLSVSPEPSLSQAAESATGPQTSGIPPSQDEAMDVVQDAVEAKPEQVEDEPFEMQFSLAEIANATDLREDDVAFTLVHSGLANFRTPLVRDQVAAPLDSGRKTPDPECSSSGIEEMQIVLTSAIVEDIATKFKVKPPVLSKAHCLF